MCVCVFERERKRENRKKEIPFRINGRCGAEREENEL
jgi:hypothetical protein